MSDAVRRMSQILPAPIGKIKKAKESLEKAGMTRAL